MWIYRASSGQLNKLVYARHGRDLMGCKSPVSESRYYQRIVAKILAEGKGDLARGGLKEAGVQVSEERDSETMSRRTEIAYKAQSPGKSAQHDESQDSGDRVNAAVV